MEISETHNNVWRVWGKGKVFTVVELKNTRERPWRVLKKKKILEVHSQPALAYRDTTTTETGTTPKHASKYTASTVYQPRR